MIKSLIVKDAKKQKSFSQNVSLIFLKKQESKVMILLNYRFWKYVYCFME